MKNEKFVKIIFNKSLENILPSDIDGLGTKEEEEETKLEELDEIELLDDKLEDEEIEVELLLERDEHIFDDKHEDEDDELQLHTEMDVELL